MKARPLRIYLEGAVWWMDHGGALTDHLIHSAGAEWVAGFFQKTSGIRVMLTDRKKIAVEFLCKDVSHQALSSKGCLAFIEYGAKNDLRIHLMRADGYSAVMTGVKGLIQVEGLAFTPNESGLILERHDGRQTLDLIDLVWKKTGRVITYGSADLPRWAVWAIFGAVAAFFVMLAVM